MFDKPTDGRDPWPARADWLRHHAAGLDLARWAAARPVLGFVFGPGGSAADPDLFHANPNFNGTDANPMRIAAVDWPELEEMATALSADARLAAEGDHGSRVEADVVALLELGRQVRRSNDFGLGDGEFAVYVDGPAVDRLGAVLADHPAVLDDATVVRLAHRLAGPRVAADLFDLASGRQSFAEFVQQSYTDDGHGSGRFAPSGVAEVGLMGVHPDVPVEAMAVAFASRAEVTARYDDLLNQAAALMALPIRQADWRPIEAERSASERSPVDRVRYAPLLPFVPHWGRLQAFAERYLGERDGLLVGLALEVYHRRHGRHPATLAELVPDLLPAVPADRVTGDPVRYRLVAGKPVVYSVGADRVDDGGRPAQDARHHPQSAAAAVWDVSPADAPRGDWVFYPPAVDDR